MAVTCKSHIIFSIVLTVSFYNSCAAIKCFYCTSANNSACLDTHMRHMHAIVPVVDCARAVPPYIGDQLFCRKITQTILHSDKSPEVRITRGCGWVKHKRECYTADNQDHLETVCQCFGDMCNAATTLAAKVTALAIAGAIFVLFQTPSCF